MQKDRTTTTDRISRRAYELWERDGWTHGRDLDHWLQAERELAGDGAAPQARTRGTAARRRPGPADQATTAKRPAAPEGGVPRPGAPGPRGDTTRGSKDT